jgi:hypothetical protein
MKRIVLLATSILIAAGFANAMQMSIVPAPDMHQMMQMSQMMRDCSPAVERAQASADDTADGIKVTVTSESGNVTELRRRLQMRTRVYNRLSARPSTTMPPRFVAGTAVYEDVPKGGAITFKPADPALLDAYRKQIRDRVELLQKGDCPMMPGMTKGMPQPGQAAPNEGNHDPLHSH